MRVLQVGYGNIGREVFRDYVDVFSGGIGSTDTYMVTDLVQPVPEGHEWDGQPVDLAVILVDTPAGPGLDGYDYDPLRRALDQFIYVADFILIRSTVSLGFLRDPVYSRHSDRIGFSPEFYGATKWSSREAVSIDFTVVTSNTPDWVRDRLSVFYDVAVGLPQEVILAKLTENAYLATKVTFFHELALAAAAEGIDFEQVRRIVTLDPRIGPDHSFMEEPGWQSHCFDKDVPAFAGLGPDLTLVRHAIRANRTLLARRRATT